MNEWWQRLTTTDRVLFSALGIALLILLSVIASSRRTTQPVTRAAAPVPRTAATTASTRATKANFEKLREGMKESEVIAILGPVSEVKYEAKDKTSSSAVYQWGSAQDGFIICAMGDGKLVSKSQVSLRY